MNDNLLTDKDMTAPNLPGLENPVVLDSDTVGKIRGENPISLVVDEMQQPCLVVEKRVFPKDLSSTPGKFVTMPSIPFTVNTRNGIGALQVPFLIAKDEDGNPVLNQGHIGWAVTLDNDGKIMNDFGRLLGRLESVCGELALVTVRGIVSFRSNCTDQLEPLQNLFCNIGGFVSPIPFYTGRGLVLSVNKELGTCEVLL